MNLLSDGLRITFTKFNKFNGIIKHFTCHKLEQYMNNQKMNSITVHTHYYDDAYIDSTTYYDTFFNCLFN